MARASSAAEPAVEPTSITPARRYSLALLDPAELTHSTDCPMPSATFSSQPLLRMIRDSGLYVA